MSVEFPDEYLRDLWNRVNWKDAEQLLAALQAKLSIAAFRRDMDEITRIQKRIVREIDIKCLAVRHVVESTSGPGVDGVRWSTPEQMMRAALSLTSKNYHAKPYRQILIQAKNSGKQRRPAIPTYYDRAMMVLYGYSLIPVAEAWADRKSFAFRQGRSIQDAQAYIFESLKGEDVPEYVVCADIHAYYSKIQHSWLLKNVPMDKYVLSEFLNAGFVFAGELFPSDGYGISEGSNISPYLGNFVLDGLQEHLYHSLNGDKPITDFKNGNLIRFADDIFIQARTRGTAEKLLTALRFFLDDRGLSLSKEKTHICSMTEGFTMLSQTYIRQGNHVYCRPSDAAVERIIQQTTELIMTFRKSQRELIMAVNSKLRGWAQYHRTSDAQEAFRKVDVAVQAALLEAVIQKHPKMQRAKIISKYWYEEWDGRHSFALPTDKSVKVIHLADTLLIQHKKVKTNVNPFLDTDYVESRTHEREIANVSGAYRALWERQQGRCYYCGRPILPDQPRSVVPFDLSRPPSVKNSVYIHKICEQNEFELIQTMEDVDLMRPVDIMGLLGELGNPKPAKARIKGTITDDWKHMKLKAFFARSTAASITLTFEEIEQIDGRKFPKTARTSSSWWYPRNNCNMIAEAWISEGYRLKALNMEKEKVTFVRSEEGCSKLEIPKVLTEGKIPDNAVYELEKHFKHIIKKYAL